MKKLFLVFSFAAIGAWAAAEAPANYYRSCENKGGKTLLSSLYNTVTAHTVISYDGLWTLFPSSDVREDGSLWDMYSTKHWTETKRCGNYKAVGDCYNREHSFPKSWFGNKSPMNSDAFHLYPTDGKVNGQRSNYPYGECANGTRLPANGNVQALGKLGASSFSGYSGVVFEPDDEYKGDFARSYFYMAVCYNDRVSGWSSPMLAGNSFPVFSDWALQLLLKWHRQDPVSNKERVRNDAVYERQKNRNPFIDHPEMVEYIWGNKADQSWSSGMDATPELHSPVNGSQTDLGVTAVGYPHTATLTVRGSYIKDDVTLSCAAPFSVSPARLAASAVNSDGGAVIKVTYNPTAVGEHSATLTLKTGSVSSQVKLTGKTVSGLPLAPATDVYSNGFTAVWTYVGGASAGDNYQFNLRVAGKSEQVSGYPCYVSAAEESYEVAELEPGTTYEFWLSGPQLSSALQTVTTHDAVPSVELFYEGDLAFSSPVGVPSQVAELLVEIENIDGNVNFEVEEPFQLSTDKTEWNTTCSLDALEDRLYMRMYGETAGVYNTEIKITSGHYLNDDNEVSGTIYESEEFVEDFEPEDKNAATYNGYVYTGSGATWNLKDAGIWASDGGHNSAQAVRMGKTAQSSVEMTHDVPDGLGMVTVYACEWTSSEGPATFALEYSTDGGRNWTEAGEATADRTDFAPYTFTVNRPGSIRMRVAQKSGKRFMLDDIKASYYSNAIHDTTAEDYYTWDAYCLDGTLVVETSEARMVDIHGVDGITYVSAATVNGKGTFSLAPGLYIVVVGEYTRRVLVK